MQTSFSALWICISSVRQTPSCIAKAAGAGEMLNIYEAGELGIDRVVKLLDATLQEKKKTDAANSACGHGHQPYG
jgi:hypothetical protein